jgi:hypothetical protein
MHFRSMIDHLIPSWKWPTSATLTAAAATNRTPEHRLLSRMSSVVVSIEVIPPCESPAMATWVDAVEDEVFGVRGGMYGADMRDG